MSAVMLYVTAGDQAEADRLGRLAVESQLAACANILAPTTAIYRWEGRVQSSSEATLVLKTTEDLAPALTEKITNAHSYDCPCVLVLPINGGNQDFLDWVQAETATPNSENGSG